MKEYHLKFRPKKLSDVVGQPDVVRVVSRWLKDDAVPHAVLISGPSGCGKTTLARIIRRKLGCHDRDYVEQNCADLRGIDSARDIRFRMNIKASGKCRVWTLDEVHRTSRDFQDAMLKLLEDTPRHVYFILCTTDPQKLLKTIITRCTELCIKALSDEDMGTLIRQVGQRTGRSFSSTVIDRIIDCAEGSPRKALVLLNSIACLQKEQDQLNIISKADHKSDAILICRALMNPRTKWADMAKLLKSCDLDDAEGLRQLVLSYCTTILLSGGRSAARAGEIIEIFRDHLFDSRKAGFVANCYGLFGHRN